MSTDTAQDTIEPVTLKDILGEIQKIEESCRKAQDTLHGVIRLEEK